MLRVFTSWTAWLACFLEEPILKTWCPLRGAETERGHQRPCWAGAQTGEDLLACDWWFLVLGALQVLLHQFGGHTDDVLALPVLDHVEGLQGADDVALGDAGHLAEGEGGGGCSHTSEATQVCVCVRVST